jgi:FkbM family methyltransferase
MKSVISRINDVLRFAAKSLPTNNPLRRALSRSWSTVIRTVGSPFLDVSLGEHFIRLRAEYRHLDPNYEGNALSAWVSLLRAGDTVWDVGANIGLYTIVSARIVGASGRVVSWEPTESTYKILVEHIVANGFSGRCHPRNAAVGDSDGTLPFAISAAEAAPTNRLGVVQGTATVMTTVETLDGLFSGESHSPAALKIDVEGAEVLALRGASRQVLAPNGPRPLLMVAVHP